MTAMIKDLETKKALYPQKDNKDLRPEMFLAQLEIGLQRFLSQKLEGISLEDFLLMLKVEDVRLVKVMVL